MGDLRIIATAVAAVAAAECVALTVGYLGNHAADVTRLWADGREWLAARRADVYTARDAVRRLLAAVQEWALLAARAVAVAVLCAVLRAHGRHRREVRA